MVCWLYPADTSGTTQLNRIWAPEKKIAKYLPTPDLPVGGARATTRRRRDGKTAFPAVDASADKGQWKLLGGQTSHHTQPRDLKKELVDTGLVPR